MNLQRGDIIFSHAQTKQLLKTGKIRGRGKTIGTSAYADGTPFNGSVKFAGTDTTVSGLDALAARLLGEVTGINTNIGNMTNDVSTIARSVQNVNNSRTNQSNSIVIGDIHISGVQDADGLAKAIKSYLPTKMLQELYK